MNFPDDADYQMFFSRPPGGTICAKCGQPEFWWWAVSDRGPEFREVLLACLAISDKPEESWVSVKLPFTDQGTQAEEPTQLYELWRAEPCGLTMTAPRDDVLKAMTEAHAARCSRAAMSKDGATAPGDE